MYGPLSLLSLMACWAAGLIAAFTLLLWAAGLRVDGRAAGFAEALSTGASALFTIVFAPPDNPWRVHSW